MQITAKIIQHSISTFTGKEIITYELEYPRYIHSEFMTHRLFSRNAASSRAIPVSNMSTQIIEHNVNFVHIGKNQPGMQAKEEVDSDTKDAALALWYGARDYCLGVANKMANLGVHKQCVNRVQEPWMMMKVVLTTTELANWEWLRAHPDAQPEIQALAIEMHKAKQASEPLELRLDEWHVPYVHRYFDDCSGVLMYGEDGQLSVKDARVISASCCAQVSYRKSDDSVEKAKAIYSRLIESEPAHSSPLEHQATPINYDVYLPEGLPHDLDWLKAHGVTSYNMDNTLSSGNFRDWIQFRQLIPNNAQW